jgi:hypothetical protein
MLICAFWQIVASLASRMDITPQPVRSVDWVDYSASVWLIRIVSVSNDQVVKV